MRDLIIAGGGPTGLAAAIYAARAGLDVAVWEPRVGTIDKACGEGLMPGAVKSLRDLGVTLDGHPLTGIRYLSGSHAATASFRDEPGCGVRRTTLHAALLAAVAAESVTIEPRAATRVEHHADHVYVDGEPARYLIAADGLHSPIRRMLGLERPPARRARYGLRGHVEILPWSSFVEVHWSRCSEAYVTPVAANLVGVAILSDQRSPFAELLAAHPLLTQRCEGMSWSRIRGAGPLRQRSRRRVAGRVLLVGDAAGYVDALTGEGIASGLAQARAAVEAIGAGKPALYEAKWRRLGWRHDLITRALLISSGFIPVRDRIVPAAAALPRVFGAAVNQLAGPL